MITRYTIHMLCSKADAEGNPRRLQVTYLSAGGNNIKTPQGEPTHKVTSVCVGEACPVKAPEDAHSFIVTPNCYNEWLEKIEQVYPRSKWLEQPLETLPPSRQGKDNG